MNVRHSLVLWSLEGEATTVKSSITDGPELCRGTQCDCSTSVLRPVGSVGSLGKGRTCDRGLEGRGHRRLRRVSVLEQRMEAQAEGAAGAKALRWEAAGLGGGRQALGRKS